MTKTEKTNLELLEGQLQAALRRASKPAVETKASPVPLPVETPWGKWSLEGWKDSL